MRQAAMLLGLDQGLHISCGSPVRPWCCVVCPILQTSKKGQIILCGSQSSLSFDKHPVHFFLPPFS